MRLCGAALLLLLLVLAGAGPTTAAAAAATDGDARFDASLTAFLSAAANALNEQLAAQWKRAHTGTFSQNVKRQRRRARSKNGQMKGPAGSNERHRMITRKIPHEDHTRVHTPHQNGSRGRVKRHRRIAQEPESPQDHMRKQVRER